MRQGIIPSISQIAGLEIADHVYAMDDDNSDPAGQTGIPTTTTMSDINRNGVSA